MRDGPGSSARRMKYKYQLLIGAFTLIVVIAAFIFCLGQPSVLVHFKDQAAVDPGDGLFVIFNPTRNREPEYAANSLLENFKVGRCHQAIGALPKDEYSPNTCEKEEEYKLTSWKLADRKDETDKVILHFKASRKDHPGNAYGNVWITAKKYKDGWKVVRYEAWY